MPYFWPVYDRFMVSNCELSGVLLLDLVVTCLVVVV